MENKGIATLLRETHKDMNMEELNEVEYSIGTDRIQPFLAYIGKSPKSCMYGKIIGFFYYKGYPYRFIFHIHTPTCKGPRVSNHMERLDKLEIRTFKDIEYIEYRDTNLGYMAFWDHTSLEYLKEKDEDAYEIRKWIIRIKKFSRRNDYCRYFRNLEKRKSSA